MTERVLVADEMVLALLPTTRQVAVRELIPVQALVATHVRMLKQCDRQTRKTAHVYFISAQTGGGAHRVLIRRFHMWQLHIPVVLTLVAH